MALSTFSETCYKTRLFDDGGRIGADSAVKVILREPHVAFEFVLFSGDLLSGFEGIIGGWRHAVLLSEE